MVSVCAGCDAYYPWTALFLGCTAGFLHLMASLVLVKLKIDDPLDAAPIHFICGKFYILFHCRQDAFFKIGIVDLSVW